MSGRRINSFNLTPTSSFNLGSRSNSSDGEPSSNLNMNSAPSSTGSLLPLPPRRRRRVMADDKREFNPRLISSQIIAMQCFHYLFLGLFTQINMLFYGTSITIDRIFTDDYIKVWSRDGLPDTFAVLLSSIVGAVLLAIIVEKSKKCLDFAVTLFLIHLVICICYDGMPKTWDWWIVNVLGTIVMVLLGEYVCSLREMSDIPLLQI